MRVVGVYYTRIYSEKTRANTCEKCFGLAMTIINIREESEEKENAHTVLSSYHPSLIGLTNARNLFILAAARSYRRAHTYTHTDSTTTI